MPISRRSFVASIPGALVAGGLAIPQRQVYGDTTSNQTEPGETNASPHFPAQDPSLVKEIVGVSHGNFARVKELVDASPALAKANWDWGYGDWESALGAASHTGNYDIARFLMEHGARPNIFTFAMMGQLDVVRAIIDVNPGIQKTRGPHGITLLGHARNGGERAVGVLSYLESLGDADIGYQSEPLTTEEFKTYTGRYLFGDGSHDYVVVSVNQRFQLLTIKRGRDGTARTLFYSGDHQFHPAGAQAVRVRFDVQGGKAMSVTVFDATRLLTARRRKT